MSKNKTFTDLEFEDLGLEFEGIVAELCKRSLFDFVKEFWDVIIPEVPVWAPHIEYICKQLELVTPNIIDRKPKKHDLLINIPPGSTKSTIITIMWPAWLWANDPSLRVISNSYSGDISTEHAVKSRDIILSDKYKRFYPEVNIRPDKSGKQSYDTDRNGARYTTSTGGTIMGKHSHVIINDDPQNQEQSQSEAHRRQAVNHTKALSSRKVNKDSTVTVTVMQRLHSEDVSGYLLENKQDDIFHIKLPAEITPKSFPIPIRLADMYVDNMLDPLRLGANAINEAKVDLGSRGYNGQWLQNPTAEGGDIIKEDWFGSITRNDFIAMVAKSSEAPTIHFFVDTAYTDKSENDPSGIISACGIGNYLYITGAKKYRLGFNGLMKAIEIFVNANGYTAKSTIRIEPKASGKSVVQSLRDGTMLNVMETPSPIDSKTTRLYAVSPMVESSRVILVESPWNEAFVEEIAGFPNMPHDEYVDLLIYAMNHCIGTGGTILETTQTLSEMGINY